MSTVFLHVGQAGCQIGEAIWPSLFQERTGGQASSSTRLRNLWKPRTKNKHVRQKRARRLQKTENGLVNLWRVKIVKEMLGDVRRTAILNSDRSWILFVKKPWRRQSSLSPGHFGGCRAQGRGSFADASQLKCRVWKVFFPYSFHILFIWGTCRNMQEHQELSDLLFPSILTGFSIVFHEINHPAMGVPPFMAPMDLSPRPNAGYTFDPTSAVTAQSGRGGNFALGYTGGLEWWFHLWKKTVSLIGNRW